MRRNVKVRQLSGGQLKRAGPVEKKAERVEPKTSLMDHANCVFMGTSVRSGSARVLVVQTAKAAVFGKIAERHVLRPPEN